MAWELQEKDGLRYFRSSMLATLPWLEHGFSTRWQLGSETKSEFNLGYIRGNEGEVTTNRERFFSLFALTGERIFMVKQVHGDRVINITEPRMIDSLEADGMLTALPGYGLATIHADCVPILIVDPLQRVIAAVHAGWRGTWHRIVEKTMERMEQEYGSIPANCWAAIGPAIGSCCYQVDAERYHLFATVNPDTTNLEGDYRLDLVEINYKYLVGIGFKSENIDRANLCTSCHQDLFFSYRREQKGERMLSLIAIKNSKE